MVSIYRQARKWVKQRPGEKWTLLYSTFKPSNSLFSGYFSALKKCYDMTMLSQQEMNRFNERIAEVEKYFQSEKNLAVGYIEVLTALMEVLKEPNPENICKRDLSEADLIRALDGYVFDAPMIIGEVSDPTIEIPGSISRIYSAINKVDRSVWEILRNDKDPHPSNPHAHNEIEDITMDLSNGKLYHDGEYVSQLRKKDVVNFRNRIAEKYPGMELPALKID
jgi:hypothetical protein